MRTSRPRRKGAARKRLRSRAHGTTAVRPSSRRASTRQQEGFPQATPSPRGKETTDARGSLKGHRRPRGSLACQSRVQRCSSAPSDESNSSRYGSKPHRRRGNFERLGAAIIDPMTGGCRIESGVNRGLSGKRNSSGTRPVHRLCYHLGSDPHSNSDRSGSDGAILSQSEQIPESYWLRESAAQRRPKVGNRSGRERPLWVISGH